MCHVSRIVVNSMSTPLYDHKYHISRRGTLLSTADRSARLTNVLPPIPQRPLWDTLPFLGAKASAQNGEHENSFSSFIFLVFHFRYPRGVSACARRERATSSCRSEE